MSIPLHSIPSTRLPALFIGHGSPMNTLEDNPYTQAWRALGAALPRPQAILAISAHWLTRGIAVTAMEHPRTIHDFGGFPQALHEVQYPAPGSTALAQRVAALLAPRPVALDSDEWGLDHGTWSVLAHLYPMADIPVVQLSMDATQGEAFHLEIGQALRSLRDEGVLIVASGNIVHNLRLMKWSQTGFGHDWAVRFDAFAKRKIEARDFSALAHYQSEGHDATLAVPTAEHFWPLLYALGAAGDDDAISFPVEGLTMGGISMRSVQIG